MKKLAIALLLFALIPAQAVALNTTELLATIAMPLAVAAVSEVTDVPADTLGSVVAMLNNAFVPAPQAIEIIRYVPVALVVDNGQPFVNFLQQQVSQGVTGTQFVTVIDRELQTYYVQTTPQITVIAPPSTPVVVDERFVPQVVTTRVAEVKAHPHGGPPGQLKKRLGLQTGASVVHEEKRGRDREAKRETKREVVPMTSAAPTPVAVPHVEKEKRVKEDHGHGHGHDKGGEGKGKGKGKKG